MLRYARNDMVCEKWKEIIDNHLSGYQ